MDTELRAACSREIAAPAPTGGGSSPRDGRATARRDNGALVEEETSVLPSDSGAKTLALLSFERSKRPGA